MTMKKARNEQLLVMPHEAFASILSGVFMTWWRRKTSIGIRCRAPYTGSMARKRVKKRPKLHMMQLSTHGCRIEQGMW